MIINKKRHVTVFVEKHFSFVLLVLHSILRAVAEEDLSLIQMLSKKILSIHSRELIFSLFTYSNKHWWVNLIICCKNELHKYQLTNLNLFLFSLIKLLINANSFSLCPQGFSLWPKTMLCFTLFVNILFSYKYVFLVILSSVIKLT